VSQLCWHGGQTLEGLLKREERRAIVRLHQNAQRLLQPLFVANPLAARLTYPDSLTRTRRDHAKYLTLIRAIALLHQHQRPIRSAAHGGKTIHYIEVIEDDVRQANRLVDEVLGRSLDELPPQTRKLLQVIEGAVRGECSRLKIERGDFRFSRKDVRRWSAWGNTVLKKHLARLEEMEYLLVHRGGRGQSFVYELWFERGADETAARLPGLLHDYDFQKSPLKEEKSPSSRPPVAPEVAGVSPPARPAQTRMNIAPNGVFHAESEKRVDPGA